MISTKKYLIVVAIFISSIALKSFGIDNNVQNNTATAIIVNNTPYEMSMHGAGLWLNSCPIGIIKPYETKICERRYIRSDASTGIYVNVPFRGGLFAGLRLNIATTNTSCLAHEYTYLIHELREIYNLDVEDSSYCTTKFTISLKNPLHG